MTINIFSFIKFNSKWRKKLEKPAKPQAVDKFDEIDSSLVKGASDDLDENYDSEYEYLTCETPLRK